MTSNPQAWEHDLITRIEAALPIDDVVAWLIRGYPEASEEDIMAMLQAIYWRDYEIGPSGGAEQRYAVGESTWDAFPQRVAEKRP